MMLNPYDHCMFLFSDTGWQVVVTVALWARSCIFLRQWGRERLAYFHLLLLLRPGLNTACPLTTGLNTHWRKVPKVTTGHLTHFAPEKDLWWPFWSCWPWLSWCWYYCWIIIVLWSGTCVNMKSLFPQYFKTLRQRWTGRTETCLIALVLIFGASI